MLLSLDNTMIDMIRAVMVKSPKNSAIDNLNFVMIVIV